MKLSDRVEKLEKDVEDIHEDINEAWTDLHGDMKEGFKEIRESIDNKLGGIRDDLSVMKGAHARTETLRDSSLLADRLGYQLISPVQREVLIGFGNLAKDQGRCEGDVESFKRIDAVLLVQDSSGNPHYLVVEASYTVQEGDVERVIRNAQYLEDHTGIKSVPVVAGKQGMVDALELAAENGVEWYQLTNRDLQPD